MTTQNKRPKNKCVSLLFILSFFAATVTVFGQSVGSLFDFTEDVRVFTAYAMMNAGGSGGEWHKEGMDPIRSQLRADLEDRLDTSFQEKIADFNESHGRILETYEAALLTSGPPDFRWSYNPKNTGEIGETVSTDSTFPDLLAEFYKKADVAQLWDEYQPLIQAENNKYKAFAHKAMEDVLSYCRLDTNYFYSNSKRIYFEFMPLLPYFTSVTARVNGDIYIIVGPQEGKPDRSVFYYQFLKRVIIPLVRSNSQDVQPLAGLFDTVKSKIDMKRGNWNRLAAECFAEAIYMRLEQKIYDIDSSQIQASLENEYKYGFILSPTIYRDLQKYEESGMSFSEYFPKLLKSINYANEIEEWNKFWAKQ
jgi:hypothetical protein